MLVIADEERGLVIAGVMGAEDAEVGEETVDALIEVATFEGGNILQTSQKLGLRTDASGRFERGLDPNMVDFAMERVVGLLTEHPEGRAANDVLSHYLAPVRPWHVPLRLERAELLLGMPVSAYEASERLVALGCEVRREDGRLEVTVPTFRRDLRREADLIEEVGRMVGLDNVPEALPAVSQPGGLTEEQRRARLLRQLLADLGLAEAITYPFGPDRWVDNFKAAPIETADEWSPPETDMRNVVRVKNPLSAEERNLRTSILPGLLDAAARNRAFGAEGGGLFELGHVFAAEAPPEDLVEAALRFRMAGELGGEDAARLMGVREEPRVGVVLAGTVRPAGWNVSELRAGFFEAKGLIERLVPGATFVPEARPFLHPGRSAAVRVGGEEVGWVGELHPEAAERFEFGGWPVAALELDPALCHPDPEPRFQPFVNVPAVARDLAVLVEDPVPVGDMLASIEGMQSPLLVEARVFDVYSGSQVPQGQKSVAFGFTFQGEQTLTDEEVNAEIHHIAARLGEEFGARVRG
jgi:phenylalanyl-tRNA synthetase beta chain